jgi:hypothetical protein
MRFLARRPRRSDRPRQDETPCIKSSILLREGAIVPGQFTHGELLILAPDGSLLFAADYVGDMRDLDNAWFELRHRVPGEPPAEPYRIGLKPIRTPSHFKPGTPEHTAWLADWAAGRSSGRQWRFVCPVRGTLSPVLWCPAGADRFASSAAHRLLRPSDAVSTAQRPLRHLQHVQCALETALSPARPQRASAKTVARLLARVAAADQELTRRLRPMLLP